MIKNIISYFIILLLFISCEPEEMPVEGFIEQYGLNYMQIELGEDYCYQKYYNLTNNMVVHENLMTEWDLAFSNESNAIILNSSKYMRVIPIEMDFNTESIKDLILNNTEWYYDNPNGDEALLAFNHHAGNLSQKFFLVDRGYDCNTNHLGYFIIEVIDANEASYFIQTIEIIVLDNNVNFEYNDILEISKTVIDDYSYYDLISNTLVDVGNELWDLCFLRYTEFNVPPPGGNDNLETLPTYRVVGVLQNSHIAVSVDTLNDFSEINIDNIINYQFNTERNTIGYDWKYYNGELGLYSIDSPVYIIRKSAYEYYKLLFLDFYNDAGEKGSPMFQIQKIEL